MAKSTPATIESVARHLPASNPIPSLWLNHSEILANELRVRVAGLESGIVTISGELDGMQAAYDRDVAEKTRRHERDIADLTKTHERDKGERERLLADLKRGKAAAEAALATLEASGP